jgi:hypothetical protein
MLIQSNEVALFNPTIWKEILQHLACWRLCCGKRNSKYQGHNQRDERFTNQHIVSLKGNWIVYLSLRLDPRITLYSLNVKLFAAQLKINCTSLQIVPTLSRVGRRYIFGKVSSTHSIKVVASPILFSPLFWVWKRLNNIICYYTLEYLACT